MSLEVHRIKPGGDASRNGHIDASNAPDVEKTLPEAAAKHDNMTPDMA